MPRLSRLYSRLALVCFCFVLRGFAAAPPFLSPEETAPGEITFRIFAPNAKQVFVEGLRHQPPAPMSRGDNGVWSVTVRNLPPDIYSYAFNVDGVTTLDDHNRNLKKWTTSLSLVEVTGPEPTVYAQRAVPHGSIHRHIYSSRVAGKELALQVYTPPGYDPRDRTRYPLIVLLHGTGDDELAWTEIGRANFIADNLIARGSMKKAVIVMPYGHPVPQPLVRPSTYPEINTVEMEKCVLTEVLPLVEANYRISQRAEDRAIVGLSMGGGHALWIGLSHPELFHWVGGFSAAPIESGMQARYLAWSKALQDRRHAPRLLWLAIGRGDALLPRNEAFTSWLREHNVPFSWQLTDGEHEWSLWREYFAGFAQTLFR